MVHRVCVLGADAGDGDDLLEAVLDDVGSVLCGQTLLQQPGARHLQVPVVCVAVVHQQVEPAAVS